MKTNVALIGFMGTGKTAVGELLAEKLNKCFVELDLFIEQTAGKTVTEIFREGEIAFRELEIAAVKEIAATEDQVIACGGGVVLNRINIDRLKKSAVIVYLVASPRTILKRTASDNTRPLLDAEDRLTRIKELLKFRKPFYERAADITVNTTQFDIKTVVTNIIVKLKENESIHFQK